MGRVLRWGVLGIAVLIAIAIAVPFLVPVSHFIPELERLAAEKLGRPVSVDDLVLHLFPAPRVVATGISVGNGQVTIGELEIVPDLMSVVSGPRTIRVISAERVEVQEAALSIPRGMPKAKSGGAPIVVHRLLLADVKLTHSKFTLPLFDVDVALGPGLRVEHAWFETRDRNLRLEVQPAPGEGVAMVLTARDWILPAGAPLLFETLTAEGALKGGELDIGRIEGLLYGGKVAGSAQISWAKQWQLSGKAALAGVDLVAVQQALGKPGKLSGRLKADAAFSSTTKTAGLLREGLVLDGPFEVHGGAYQGVDLTKAGDLTGQPALGDATMFEELRGVLQLRGKQVKLNELCVRSEKVVAGGNVEIAADDRLSGKLDVSVAKTGGFVGVPVSLGGTTAEPSVSPSKGYVIGAAIGTVLLPIIGTTIGSSIGSRIEGTNSNCR
jgi:hypothetical protein